MILTPLFQQQTITIFSGTNPAQVAWWSKTKDILRSIAKDIQSLVANQHAPSIPLTVLVHTYA